MHTVTPYLLAFYIVLGLCGVALLVRALSAVASRAYFAQKEKHIRRVLTMAKQGDEK